MIEQRAVEAARAALRAAELRLPERERAEARSGGRARRRRVEHAGSYRAALRHADGSDAVERR